MKNIIYLFAAALITLLSMQSILAQCPTIAPTPLVATVCQGQSNPTFSANPSGNCAGPSCLYNAATSNLSITLQGTHTYVSDLTYWSLEGAGPQGNVAIVLYNGFPSGNGQSNPVTTNDYAGSNVCNSGDNFNITFSYAAAANMPSICTMAAPLSGTHKPETAETALNGINFRAYTWTVRIYDCVGADVGVLQSAALTITEASCNNLCLSCGGSATSGTFSASLTGSGIINDNSCSAATASALTIVPTSLPARTIKWYNAASGGILLATSDTYTPTATTPGTYTYYAEVNCGGVPCVPCNAGVCGSSSRTAVTLTISALPSATVTGTNVICSGATTTFTANATAGSGSITNYAWSNAQSGAALSSINVSAATTYTVTVTNTGGCTATANRVLTLNALPTVNITGATAICNGASATLTANVTAGGGTITNYAWSNGQSGITQNTINVGASATYVVTVTNSNTCTATANKVLTVNAVPTVSITGVNAICAGASTSLTANATAGSGSITNYVWSTAQSGAAQTTISASTAATYTVTVTNSNTCTAAANMVLTVNALPTVSVTGINAICAGASTSLTANATAGSGSITNYAWSNAQSGVAQTSINTNTASTYTVTVTNSNTCTATANRIVTVNAVPTVNITGTNTICAGTTTSFAANATAGSGSLTNYAWSNSQSGAAQTSVSLNAAGTYIVTVTNSNTCTATANRILTVNAIPTASISGLNAICAGANTTLTANATAGSGTLSTYQWVLGGVNIPSATNATYMAAAAGTYSLAVTNSNACTASVSTSVSTSANPALSITGPTQTCSGQPITLTATASGVTYNWGNSGGNTSTATFTPTTNSTYTLTVTNTSGCTASASSTVSLLSVATQAFLATSNTNQTVLSTACEDNGWTYYADPTNTNHYLFAINWNPNGGTLANATQKAAAQVTINVSQPLNAPQNGATYINNVNQPNQSYYQACDAASSQATFAMRRYWNVNVGGGTLPEPVSVKFYFDPAEYNAIVNAATQWSVAHGGYVEAPVWFKTVSSTSGVNNPFNPSTDMTPTQVEPSGWVIELVPTTINADNNVTYVQFDGVASFSGGTAAVGVGTGNALPVELIYFRGHKDTNASVLEWATETELNCDYFDVERSTDAITFEKIGRVAGHGNSNERQDYTFTDRNPYSGSNYYRLRQVDFDGTVNYTPIVTLSYGEAAHDFGINVYPNPIESHVMVDFQNAIDGDVRLEAYDMEGRLVAIQIMNTTTANGTASFETANWAAGVYMLKVTNANTQKVEKLIKSW